MASINIEQLAKHYSHHVRELLTPDEFRAVHRRLCVPNDYRDAGNEALESALVDCGVPGFSSDLCDTCNRAIGLAESMGYWQ